MGNVSRGKGELRQNWCNRWIVKLIKYSVDSPCPLSQASRHQSPQAVLVSLLWQWLIGVLMKPSLQSPDQSHLISCRVYRSVLAQRHSLEHSSGVHRQVFQRYEWIVFVSANWGLILHGRDSCFLRAFTLASPMLSQCWNVTLKWGGGVDGTYCTNLLLMQKYKPFFKSGVYCSLQGFCTWATHDCVLAFVRI